jgi:hypothetical protein
LTGQKETWTWSNHWHWQDSLGWQGRRPLNDQRSAHSVLSENMQKDKIRK